MLIQSGITRYDQRAASRIHKDSDAIIECDGVSRAACRSAQRVASGNRFDPHSIPSVPKIARAENIRADIVPQHAVPVGSAACQENAVVRVAGNDIGCTDSSATHSIGRGVDVDAVCVGERGCSGRV